MRILVYKRTHRGDPDKTGKFGVHDCMGRVRLLPYDAVIGIGVKKPDAGHEVIAEKITWVGIGPKIGEKSSPNHRAETITFDKFIYLEEDGPKVSAYAKKLSPDLLPRYVIMYESKPRYEEAYKEAKSIIDKVISGEIKGTAFSNASDQKASESKKSGCGQ